MPQQTAVEWLIKEFNLESYTASINLAMEKEKEQITDAYLKGDSNGCGCYDYSDYIDAENYYKEYFNKI